MSGKASSFPARSQYPARGIPSNCCSPGMLSHNALMQRITPRSSWPLHSVLATRALEADAQASLPAHTLMQLAGLAIAKLGLALAPHAQRIWVACGPGNNGGDGLEAAMHWQHWGKQPVVTWLGDETSAPADAKAALARARAAGVCFAEHPPTDLTTQDLCVDALLGLGQSRAPMGRMAEWLTALRASPATLLAVDLPSGLNADTGQFSGPNGGACHTLALLTLKPGLFTAQGRDTAGQIWWDDLGTRPGSHTATALLNGPPPSAVRLHATHKGSFGDVAVLGGAPGMAGAALLAGQAALHGGAGRVFVGLLDRSPYAVDPGQPELMLRDPATLDMANMTVVCGCGGGAAVHASLPAVLSTARHLVFDADALNAIALDTALQTLLKARARRQAHTTVLTPHPLEAARLLGTTAAAVQADRLKAAQQLASTFGVAVVLKGSGSVIAAPQALPCINPTGNGLLATAGTGDVLAGLVGARLAQGLDALPAACAAVYQHGQLADFWPTGKALTASALARAARPIQGATAP